MDDKIGYALIDAELRRLRHLPYSELIKLVGKPQTKQVKGEDGKSYQLEIEAIWDTTRADDVRVIVAADDGGWRSLKPLTGDFIMRPDGSLAYESVGGPDRDWDKIA